MLRGKAVFHEAGCPACHQPTFVTHRLEDRPEQSFQLIWPYTDLLLHDMGEGLADHRPEGRATGTEWRTAPLWGIGLTEQVGGGRRASSTTAGRARSSRRSSGTAARRRPRRDAVVALAPDGPRRPGPLPGEPLMRLALALAPPRHARPSPGVEEVVESHILPGVAAFAEATAMRWPRPREADCTAGGAPPGLPGRLGRLGARSPTSASGPSEAAALTIAFWPDERGAGAKALRGLLAAEDPAGRDPAAYAEVVGGGAGLPGARPPPAATRELSAYAQGSYACALVRTVAADLAAQAAALAEAWPAEAEALRTAGRRGQRPLPVRGRGLPRRSTPRSCRAWSSPPTPASAAPWASPTGPAPPAPRPGARAGPLPNALASAEAAARLARAPGRRARCPPPRRRSTRCAARPRPSTTRPSRTSRTPRRGSSWRSSSSGSAPSSTPSRPRSAAPRGLQPGFNSRDGD